MADLFTLGMKADTSQLRGARDEMGRFTKSAKGVETQTVSMTRAIGLATAAIASFAASTRSVQTITNFEDAILGLGAVTRATTSDMAKMEDQARQLGASSVFSATEAANAQRFLAQAGLDVNEVLEATPTALTLAQAGALDLASAADIASNVLGGMRLEVDQFNRVADVMAETAASSNTNIEQLGQALSFAAPVASGAGLSIEETSAAIGKLSDAGLQGTRAGTGLLGVIRQLSAPSAEAEKVLAKYGLTLEDVSIETNGFKNVLEATATAGLSTADMFKVFGSEAQPAAAILMDNVSALDQLTTGLENAEGAAEDMANIMSSGLSAAFKGFNSQLSESILQVGDSGLTQSLTNLTRAATGVLAVYNDLDDEFTEANGLTASQMAGIRGIADALEDTAEWVGTAAVGYATYRTVLMGAAVAQGIFSKSLLRNPLALAALAAGAVATQFIDIKDVLKTISDELDEIFGTSEEALTIEGQIAAISAEIGDIQSLEVIDDKSAERLFFLFDELDRLEALTKKPLVIEINNGVTGSGGDDTPEWLDVNWERVGLRATNTIIGAMEDGDWSNVGADIGGMLGTTIGTALGGPIVGAVAGALVSGILAGKEEVGSDTTVNLGGGSFSGYDTTYYSGGLLSGSSSTSSALGSSDLSQLSNSFLYSTNSINSGIASLGLSLVNGVDTFTGSVTVAEGDYSAAIDTLTNEYVEANVSYIEDFQRVNEDAIDTLSRLADDLADVEDSFSFVSGSTDLSSTFSEYIENQAASIQSGIYSTISSLQSQSNSVQADLDRARSIAASVPKTDDNYSDYYLAIANRLRDAGLFVGSGYIGSVEDYYNGVISDLDSSISEQYSRLGQATSLATAQFTTDLTNAVASINGVDVDSASDLLYQQAVNYEEAFYSSAELAIRAQERAAEELEAFSSLGIDATTSMTEFREAFEAFQSSSAFTPQAYAQ